MALDYDLLTDPTVPAYKEYKYPTDLIYDRKRSDIGNNAKGFLNASDLNRIGKWAIRAKELAEAKGHTIRFFEISQNYTRKSVPPVTTFDKIKESITAINEALGGIPEWYELYFSDFVDIYIMNDIELDIQNLLNYMQNPNKSSAFYSNKIYSGEDGIS